MIDPPIQDNKELVYVQYMDCALLFFLPCLLSINIDRPHYFAGDTMDGGRISSITKIYKEGRLKQRSNKVEAEKWTI